MRILLRWWVALPLVLACLVLGDMVRGSLTAGELQDPPGQNVTQTPAATAEQEGTLVAQEVDEGLFSDAAVEPLAEEGIEPQPLESNELYPLSEQDTAEEEVQGTAELFEELEPEEAQMANRPGGRMRGAIPAPGPVRGINIGPRAPAPAYTTYLGSQTPSLSVDWVTPASIQLGQEGIYELVLQNPGRVPVERIVIEQVLPRGFRLVDAQPNPEQNGEEPVWRISRLAPQEEARITLRLVPEVPGEAQSQARVTFSTFSTASFSVVEPMLEIAVEGDNTVIVGNQSIFTVTVRNPGTGAATNTILNVKFPEGLTHVADSSTYDLGTLNPDEARSIQVVADVVGLGEQTAEFIAVADGGLRDEADKQVRALGARLELTMDGPGFRYVTRPAQYTMQIRNTGTAAAQNLRLRCGVPASFEFLEADHGGRFDASGNTINWFLGQLNPGEEIELQCNLRAMDKGEFPIAAQAVAERGLSANVQHSTVVEGIAAILLEVVDVDDPVEVGTDTFYEILITNQGTNFATNVQIIGEAPEGIAILGGKGPTNGRIEGQTIRFAPLPRLAPRADAIYRVMVRGGKAGDFRMKVQATADTLDEPVMELESTKVYQD